jgi:glutamine amidotransferase
MGNLGSIQNMLKKIGEQSIISSDKEDIKNATKIVLPGVGSFDKAMSNLEKLSLTEIIKKKVLEDKTPIIGICLGMQLLTKGSEEGTLKGFNFIDAYSKKFDFSLLENSSPVPHMGWNKVYLEKESKLLEDNIDRENRFYFVHSYAVSCNNREDILTTTNYGYEFVSSFEKNNIIGCQFHPEKSHKFGMKLLKNFVENY